MQHGLIDYQLAVHMFQAISATDTFPIVRVPCNDAAMIGKCLDAGARGVIIPMINSADEAADHTGQGEPRCGCAGRTRARSGWRGAIIDRRVPYTER
jgi:HpcH/HpaI aldolase/citrate lyase family